MLASIVMDVSIVQHYASAAVAKKLSIDSDILSETWLKNLVSSHETHALICKFSIVHDKVTVKLFLQDLTRERFAHTSPRKFHLISLLKAKFIVS